MPDMHGLEVVKFLKGQARYDKIPVIILTTRGDEDARSAALAAGASLYLTKPFQPNVLASHAQQLLNRNKG